MFNDILGVEGEFGVIPSESRTLVFDIWNITYRAHLIAQFGASDPDKKLIPFVLFGGGAMQIVSTKNPDVIGKDTDAEALRRHRREVPRRQRLGPARRRAASCSRRARRATAPTVDYEALLSIYKEFGRKMAEEGRGRRRARRTPTATASPTTSTSARTSPRTRTASRTRTAAPIPTTTATASPTRTTSARTSPRTRTASRTTTAAPIPTTTATASPTRRTSARTSPRTRTASRTTTAAPIPTTTATASPTRNDKCPNEPETINGFQDDDGCPDEIPEKVKQFTGVIQGINFKVSSADLLPGSNGTLDKAVAVLKEFPELKLEIQGHTDDQPLKAKGGKFADNAALSQARAESVKAYFVKKGIDAMRA